MKKAILLLVLFICSTPLFSQNPNLVEDSTQTNIIGVKFINGKSVFLSYNYTTGITDTLLSINDTVSCYNFAFDPYRRLFFYYKLHYLGISNNLWRTEYYTVNLFTGQRDSLFSIVDSSTHLSLEYDIFSNNLLFRMGDKLLGFNMVNRKIDTLMSIPYSNVIYASYADFFDYKNRVYIYRTHGSSYSSPDNFVKLDLKTLTVDSIFSFTNLSLPGDACYDISSGNFYAFQQKSLPGNITSSSIVEVNPSTMTWNNKLVLPGYNYSHLNQQKASFDSKKGLYLLLSVDGSTNINNLVIFDVATNTIQLKNFNFSNNNCLDNHPNPLLVWRDSILEGSYSNDYSWYYNGTLISGASQQHYVPQHTGLYKFSTHRPDGSIAFSNEVYVSFNSIKNLSADYSINAYPNPVNQILTIRIAGDIHIKSMNIEVYNSIGLSIINNIHPTTKTFKIDLSSFPQGLYFIRVSDASGKSVVKTIVKE